MQLKKAGRNLKGLCPFHHEKTPSFIVSPDKDIAYCFGCQQGGDIFKFTQLVENCDFGEAVKMLAERTGVPLPRVSVRTQNKRLRTIEANQAATAFFRQSLQENPAAMEYLLKRGLTPQTIADFELGFAPDSFSALKDHLRRQDFSDVELIEAGLLNQRSIADKSSYDRFRNRLIFPIFDHQGNAVGFGGRVTGEGEPKYLNSPDTPAYNKSTVLYGLHRAKETIKKEDMAIFVEGYMDVIAAHQAGTLNVVSTSGTALTPQQLKLIKRTTNNIAFSFDQDKAGLDATFRAIELAQLAEFNIHIITVPNGKDPDECIQSDPDAWKRAVQNPVTSMDFYFLYARRLFDPNTLEGKKGFLALLLPLIKQYPTEMEQGYHLERLANTLRTETKLLWNDLRKVKTLPRPAETATPETAIASAPVFSREAFLLGFIFYYPHLYPGIASKLIDNIPFDPATERFYNVCKSVYKQKGVLTGDDLQSALNPEDKALFDLYRLLIDEHYPDFSEEAAAREAGQLVLAINRHNLYRIQKEYEFKIRAAGGGETHLLLNQYNEILKLKAKV